VPTITITHLLTLRPDVSHQMLTLLRHTPP